MSVATIFAADGVDRRGSHGSAGDARAGCRNDTDCLRRPTKHCPAGSCRVGYPFSVDRSLYFCFVFFSVFFRFVWTAYGKGPQFGMRGGGEKFSKSN